MSFSDDDLRDLKRRLKTNKYSVGHKVVVDLIARLEVAEKGFEALEESRDLWIDYKEWIPRLVQAYDRWRKEVGNDN